MQVGGYSSHLDSISSMFVAISGQIELAPKMALKGYAMTPIEKLKKKNRIEMLQTKIRNMKSYIELEGRLPTDQEKETATKMLAQVEALQAELEEVSEYSDKISAIRSTDKHEAKIHGWGFIE